MSENGTIRATAPQKIYIEEVTDATFERDVIKQDGLVYVFFYSSQCAFCTDMLQTLESIGVAFKDNFKFVKVDTLRNPSFARKYEMNGAPYSVILRKGEMLRDIPEAKIVHETKSSWAGNVVNVQYYLQWLNSVLNRANFN